MSDVIEPLNRGCLFWMPFLFACSGEPNLLETSHETTTFDSHTKLWADVLWRPWFLSVCRLFHTRPCGRGQSVFHRKSCVKVFDRRTMTIIQQCCPVYLQYAGSILNKVREFIIQAQRTIRENYWWKLQPTLEFVAVNKWELLPLPWPSEASLQAHLSGGVCVRLLPPGVGLWVGEECGALGSYLPMGARSQPHVDSNRPKPRSTLGQVCMWSQVEDANPEFIQQYEIILRHL